MSEFGADSENDSMMLSCDNGDSSQGRSYIDLVVQGKEIQYEGARNVRSLLESQGENSVYANVRINGSVLRRRDFENIPLHDGDNIDFLYYMGGGACLISVMKKSCVIRGTSSFLKWEEPDSRS